MSFFNQIFQKLFPTDAQAPPTQVKEMLKRSEKEKMAYQTWLSENKHIDLLKPIAQAYFYKKTNIISAIQVHLFNSPIANGFALTYQNSFGKQTFSHLLDYFKEIVLEFNYYLQTAERQITDKQTFVETSEKYYLKPKIHTEAMAGQICNQLYGNVLLEQIWVDNEPSYLKVMITCYFDRNFTAPLDYNELINRLLVVD